MNLSANSGLTLDEKNYETAFNSATTIEKGAEQDGGGHVSDNSTEIKEIAPDAWTIRKNNFGFMGLVSW